MKRFDHLSALQQLLDIDTTLMKEELYYPWYIEKPGIIKITALWLSFCAAVTLFTYLYSDLVLVAIIALLVLTIILATNYLFLIKEKLKEAREMALAQTMQLEKRDFMKAIQPFVPDDQKHIARKIIKNKDYTAAEYARITLSSKSRILFNTEKFIKQIENIFSDPKIKFTIPEPDNSYDDFKFKVPKQARKKYEQMKNQSTFNDQLEVSDETKQAIVKKTYDAMHHAALGREIIELNK